MGTVVASSRTACHTSHPCRKYERTLLVTHLTVVTSTRGHRLSHISLLLQVREDTACHTSHCCRKYERALLVTHLTVVTSTRGHRLSHISLLLQVREDTACHTSHCCCKSRPHCLRRSISVLKEYFPYIDFVGTEGELVALKNK